MHARAHSHNRRIYVYNIYVYSVLCIILCDQSWRRASTRTHTRIRTDRRHFASIYTGVCVRVCSCFRLTNGTSIRTRDIYARTHTRIAASIRKKQTTNQSTVVLHHSRAAARLHVFVCQTLESAHAHASISITREREKKKYLLLPFRSSIFVFHLCRIEFRPVLEIGKEGYLRTVGRDSSIFFLADCAVFVSHSSSDSRILSIPVVVQTSAFRIQKPMVNGCRTSTH